MKFQDKHYKPKLSKTPNFWLYFLPPAFFLIIMRVLYMFEQPIGQSILPSHTAAFRFESTGLQFTFYLSFIGMTALVSFFMLLSRKFHTPSNVLRLTRNKLILTLIMIVLVFIAGESSDFIRIGFFTPLLFLGILFWRNNVNRTSRILSNNAWKWFAIFYFITAILLPLFLPLVVNNIHALVGMESHYAMTVLPGYDLACCNDTGSFERSNYGLSMAMLSALGYEIISFFSLGHNPFVSIVKGYQVVATCLILFTLYVLNKRNFWALAVIALVITPSLTMIHDKLLFPNQLGIRYIPFIIGLMTLAIVARKKHSNILVLGLISALLILLNPETGAVISVGNIVFLLLTRHDVSKPFSSTIKTLVTFVLITLPVLYILLKFYGNFSNSSNDTGLFSSFQLFFSGYGGIVEKPSVFATFLLFFSAAALFRGILAARNNNASQIDAYQAAIGVIIMLWLTYYINRMSSWNLWFQAVLLMFLFAPRIGNCLSPSHLRKTLYGAMYMAISISLIAAVLLDSLHVSKRGALSYIRESNIIIECRKEQHILGYCYTGNGKQEILDQHEYLRNLKPKQDYLVLSHLPTQVRLLGYNEGFPWYEPFGEIGLLHEFDEITNWIEQNGPEYVVTESNDTIIGMEVPARRKHLDNIIANVENYEEYKAISNWRIYKRKE